MNQFKQMSLFDEISADPNKPLSVDEFRRAWERFKDSILSSDSQIERYIAEVSPAEVKAAIDTAIRGAKFDFYKKIFWNRVEKIHWD